VDEHTNLVSKHRVVWTVVQHKDFTSRMSFESLPAYVAFVHGGSAGTAYVVPDFAHEDGWWHCFLAHWALEEIENPLEVVKYWRHCPVKFVPLTKFFSSLVIFFVLWLDKVTYKIGINNTGSSFYKETIVRYGETSAVSIVTYRPITRQRLGKHIPAGAKARNIRTYISRQRMSKRA
jgi:hypothetical protein